MLVSEVGKGKFHKIDKFFFVLGEKSEAWQIRFWYKNTTIKEKMVMWDWVYKMVCKNRIERDYRMVLY